MRDDVSYTKLDIRFSLPACLLHLTLRHSTLLQLTVLISLLATPTYANEALNPLVLQPEVVHRCISNSGPNNTVAADDLTHAREVDLSEGVNIFAREVDYTPDQQLRLEGDIEFAHGPYKVTSDRASIDQSSNEAELSGNIRLSSPELLLWGDEAKMDMESQLVSLTEARFSNPQTSVNGHAREISRSDENTLNIIDGLFTSCPPEQRDWAFAANEITLDKETGFGEAFHTRLLIRDVPVLYIPWFRFPIDDRRKSGFLFPTISKSNTGRGAAISTPYYFNLAPNYDATLTPHYVHGRGEHFELESRHKTELIDSKLITSYIHRDKHYQGEQAGLGIEDTGERWGLSFEQQYNAHEDGWFGTIKYAEISDFDYLEDLNQGLQSDREDGLDRRAEFYFAQDNWRLSLLLQQSKSIEESVLPSEESYQRLPEINYEFDAIFNRFHLDWHSQYVYFYREKDGLVGDERTYGTRFRHTPTLSLPLSKPWGYVKPSVTLDHTDYILQAYTPVENHLTRTIPIYEFDSSLYLDRPSLFSENQFFRSSTIRHSLEPRVYYVYSKRVDQDDIPNFDSTLPSFNYQRLFSPYRFSGGDRVGDNNRITLGLTNRWTDMNTGEDKAVFSIGQIYHFSDRIVNINGIGQSDRNESTFATELLLRPYPGIELGASALWDAETNQTQEGNSRINFHTEDYRYIANFSHRYIRGELEQIDTSLISPVSEQMSLLGRWRYDLTEHRSIGTLAGIEYSSCCWRIQFFGQTALNSDGEVESGWEFRFQFKGASRVGPSNSKMNQRIPGYTAREERFN